MSRPQHAFGSRPPFTIGVEEELFLVDPVTGRQVNSSAAVLDALGATEGQVARELHASQVELISEVHASAGEATAAIGALRAAVADTGVGILASGTHPTAAEGDAEITDRERYERIRYLLGDAVADPVSGLHVHVGMPDPATAIRVYNALRRDLPVLQALAANSPFRHGRDTGLASAREVTLRAWPRSGTPRAFADFADFAAMTERLARAADVDDYTWFWWKLRPHPRLGTVEIRALDAQTDLPATASIAALVHCLARHAAEAEPEPDPAPELVEEGLFRAARFGVEAELPDASGTRTPVRELLESALERARPWAAELGCQTELSGLSDLVARGGGAGAQRAIQTIAGTDAVTRELTRRTLCAGS